VKRLFPLLQKSVANRTCGHIKSKSIPYFELSKLSLILPGEYQQPGIDLVDREKSLNCRIIHCAKNPADLQAQDGKNVRPHFAIELCFFVAS